MLLDELRERRRGVHQPARLSRALSKNIYFWTTFRRAPTAIAEGQIEPEGGVGKKGPGCDASSRTIRSTRGSSAFAVGILRDIKKKYNELGERCRGVHGGPRASISRVIKC